MPDALTPSPDALPAYFAMPAIEGETFGRLRYVADAKGRYWEIVEAEPQAVVMAKQLFPGSEGRGAGVAKFPAGPRQMAELLWFLQRWPMAIDDRPRFEAQRAEAAQRLLERQAFRAKPVKVEAPAHFTGTLRAYQSEGVGWMVSQRRTLLADDMGLGKTVQAIAALAELGHWPVLIVVPPHIVKQWEAMLDAFLDVGAVSVRVDLFEGRESHHRPNAAGLRAGAGRPSQPPALRCHTIRGLSPYDLPEAEIYLTHYLLLSAHRAMLRERDLRAVVFDEVQELRHRTSAKYSAAHDLAAAAESCFGLSGTPIYNRGGEIWNVTNVIEMHCLGDWDSFTREWCGAYGSGEVSEPDRLGRHLEREGLMLRRRKRDVGQELPKRRILQAVDGDAGQYHRLVARAVELAAREAETKDQLERGRLRREIDAITRHATGVTKAAAALHFVKSLLDAGDAVLCFAWHHEVVDRLREGLGHERCAAMTGRETTTQKADAQAAFVEARVDALVLNLRTSAGLDGLQARNPVVVFVELDWSPSVHAQCEDRAARPGFGSGGAFEGEALCYYLVSEFGSDPEMRDRLGLKIQQISGVMGDAIESEEDRALAAKAASKHLDRVIATLRAQRGPGYAAGKPTLVRST